LYISASPKADFLHRRVYPGLETFYSRLVQLCGLATLVDRISKNPGPFQRLLWLPFLFQFFCFDLLTSLNPVENLRLSLSYALQALDQENQWGVGQTGAVLAWLPFLVETLGVGYRKYASIKPRRNGVHRIISSLNY